MVKDLNHLIRVTGGRIFLPRRVIGEEMDVILNVEEIERITLVSDIEALAGVGAVDRPSKGPGVYPRTNFTQTVYIGIYISASQTGRMVIPRELEDGYLDLLSLAEEIEEKTGISVTQIDDFTGRYYIAQGSMFVGLIALITLLLGF